MPCEFSELISALSRFRLTTADILAKGGNESQIPKRLASLFRPMHWFETRIRGDLVVTIETHTDGGTEKTETRLEDFMDGHKVDFVTVSPSILNGTAKTRHLTATCMPSVRFMRRGLSVPLYC